MNRSLFTQLKKHPAIPMAIAAVFHAFMSVLRYFFDQAYMLPVGYALTSAAIIITAFLLVRYRPALHLRPGHFLTLFLMLGFIVSCAVATSISKMDMFHQNRLYLYDTFMTLMFFYPLGHCVGRLKRHFHLRVFLHIVLTAWSLFMLFVVIRIFQVRPIPVPLGGYIYMNNDLHSLCLNCNPNTTGLIQMIFFLLALFLAVWDKYPPLRFLCLCMALVNYAALVLSDSRTSITASVLGVSLMTFVVLLTIRPSLPLRYRLLYSAVGAAIAVVLCLLMRNAISYLYEVLVRIPNTSPIAAADSLMRAAAGDMRGRTSALVGDVRGSFRSALPPEQAFVLSGQASTLNGSLDILLNRLLTGRLTIWTAAFKTMTSSPRNLLAGVTPAGVRAAIYEQTAGRFNMYTHNQFLEIGVSLGLPCLIAFFASLVLDIIYAVRLFRLGTARRTALLVPMLAAVLILANMTEATLLFYQFPSAYLFFFLSGWLGEKWIYEQKRLRRLQEKAAEQPQEKNTPLSAYSAKKGVF